MVTLAIDFYRSATSRPAVIRAGRWSLRLATRLLARALNMPEPLLHSTGAFVVAHAQAAEARAAKTLCPFRLLRQFWARQRSAR
jgi:hypothetical protein